MIKHARHIDSCLLGNKCPATIKELIADFDTFELCQPQMSFRIERKGLCSNQGKGAARGIKKQK